MKMPSARPGPHEIEAPGTSTPSNDDLSRRCYSIAAVTVCAVYLLIWLLNFDDVYGWVMDDRVLFIKGMDTVRDWKGAFSYYNALQPYFYLVSYLPLKLGISLSSHPLPTFGEQTGAFRFLLMWTTILHGLILLVWAWFAAALIRHRTVALISLLLLAASPTFILWTPQPESRILGLPFALVAFWLLMRDETDATSRRLSAAVRLFAAGSLLWLAQNVHYTAFYLVGPVCFLYWVFRLWREWRLRAFWRRVVVFVVGCVWLQIVLELVSHYAVGIPWEKGPFATLIELRKLHGAHWGTLGSLGQWGDSFVSQFGVPLILACVAGWFVGLGFTQAAMADRPATRFAFVGGIPLCLLYVTALTKSMAFFRQSSVLQPFLFLFAAMAIVGIARFVVRRAGIRATIVAVGVIVVCWIPFAQARQVFAAHLSLGRTLAWVERNKGERPVEWLPIAWFPSSPAVSSMDELRRLSPETWIISYYPWSFDRDHPSFQAYVQQIDPIFRLPSLYATDTMWAELKAFAYNDFRGSPLMADVRVLELGPILKAMDGVPLSVKSVTSDSVDCDAAEPANVFDYDASPDGATAWKSDSSPCDHWLRFDLTQPTELSWMQIVLPPTDKSNSRIVEMRVDGIGASGESQCLWAGDRLDRFAVIDAKWSRAMLSSLEVTIHRQRVPFMETQQATIEEIILPGYRVIGPAPRRTFPVPSTQGAAPADPPILGSVSPASTPSGVSFNVQPDGSSAISIECERAIPGTEVIFDGVPIPAFLGTDRWMSANVPARFLTKVGVHTIRLRNAQGESDSIVFTVMEKGGEPARK
jgi:hypothetical protein